MHDVRSREPAPPHVLSGVWTEAWSAHRSADTADRSRCARLIARRVRSASRRTTGGVSARRSHRRCASAGTSTTRSAPASTACRDVARNDCARRRSSGAHDAAASTTLCPAACTAASTSGRRRSTLQDLRDGQRTEPPLLHVVRKHARPTGAGSRSRRSRACASPSTASASASTSTTSRAATRSRDRSDARRRSRRRKARGRTANVLALSWGRRCGRAVLQVLWCVARRSDPRGEWIGTEARRARAGGCVCADAGRSAGRCAARSTSRSDFTDAGSRATSTGSEADPRFCADRAAACARSVRPPACTARIGIRTASRSRSAGSATRRGAAALPRTATIVRAAGARRRTDSGATVGDDTRSPRRHREERRRWSELSLR